MKKIILLMVTIFFLLFTTKSTLAQTCSTAFWYGMNVYTCRSVFTGSSCARGTFGCSCTSTCTANNPWVCWWSSSANSCTITNPGGTADCYIYGDRNCSTPPPCNYGSWSNVGCGLDVASYGVYCSASQMLRTRTSATNCPRQYQCFSDSTPAWTDRGCNSGYGNCGTSTDKRQTRNTTYSCNSESQCVGDPSCGWTNRSCGAAGGCPEGQRHQTYACTYACATNSRCVNDASCPPPIATPTPVPPPSLNSMTQTCSGNIPEISLSWTGSGTYFADVATDPAFGSFWNRDMGVATSATAPTGFATYPSGSPTMPALIVGQTYYSRIFNGSWSNVRSLTIDSSCAPPPATPYFKVKDASFYKLGNLTSTITATSTVYDGSDTSATVFNQGTSGIVVAQGAINVGTGTTSSSGWSRATQNIPNTFNASSFKSYLATKKTMTTITNVSQITSAGTYYYNGDLTISADIAQSNVILVVNGNVTISGSGAPVMFNSTNRPFALVVSGTSGSPKTLTFADSLTEAHGVFVADDIQFSTNESFPSSTPLKIVGNVGSTAPVSVIRARSATPTAPSLFIVFDPTQYVGLFDKLSIVKSSWTQIQ